jgi:adenylate cyclase
MSSSSVPFWVGIALAGAAFGGLYDILLDNDLSGIGMIYGACIGTFAVAYERGVLLSGYTARLRRLPTLAYFAAAEASLLAVVVFGMAAAGSLIWLSGLADKGLADAVSPKLFPLLYAMAVCAVLIFVLRVRDLLGSETFVNLMLGRYHRPVSEERVFLFLDLVGSTSYAERHGDLPAQELLKAVFAAVAEPIRRHRGQVDDYVGDQIIVSWPLTRGIEQARCVACIFAIRAALRRDRERWLARFGLVPELRAALHGGSVVTAEVGVDRHKIAYFGDVMNATARLEGLCREVERPVLVSDAVLTRLTSLPDGVEVEALGRHRLRGRNGAMLVHALAERRRFGIVADITCIPKAESEPGFTSIGQAARVG